MNTQAELDAILSQVSDDVAAAAQAVSDGFKRLEALIAAGAPPVDLTAEVTKLSDLHTALLNVIATANAEAPTPPVQ